VHFSIPVDTARTEERIDAADAAIELPTDRGGRRGMISSTSHPRGLGLLPRRARCLLALRRRLVDDSTQTTTLVLNALGLAIRRRKGRDGLVIHSDRGVQFTSWAFSQSVRQAGLAPSMGAVARPYDDAMVESLPGPPTGRTAQPPEREDPHRARHRDPRLHLHTTSAA
jgi:hypothetical protein